MEKLRRHFKGSALVFCILLAGFFFGDGCALQKPPPDPLAGWKILLNRDREKLSQAIRDDYRDYIRKLLTKKNYFINESNIWFFEDGTGQHAVRIEIPSNGIWFAHDLIYDKNNKRTKVITYKRGAYRS